MTTPVMADPEAARKLADAVARGQELMAHAWMVRTFVKHSPEAEQFPELMLVARTIFDVSRSLESRVGQPAEYIRQLRKKQRRLREAAEAFRRDAPGISDHTNFKQAVVSFDACVAGWDRLLASLPTGLGANENSAPLDAGAAAQDNAHDNANP